MSVRPILLRPTPLFLTILVHPQLWRTLRSSSSERVIFAASSLALDRVLLSPTRAPRVHQTYFKELHLRVSLSVQRWAALASSVLGSVCNPSCGPGRDFSWRLLVVAIGADSGISTPIISAAALWSLTGPPAYVRFRILRS